ncbi:MAG TPA: methyl-accepting chemotaxis protein [Bacillota bacterium]|nr:methyl-accepting chemotaxis protein [Bacillota bacterium]
MIVGKSAIILGGTVLGLIAVIVAICFYRFLKHVKRLNAVLATIAEGQLSARVSEEGFLRGIGVNINRLVRYTKKVICEIAETSEKNRAMAESLNKNITQVDRAGQEIAISISEVAQNAGEQSNTVVATKDKTQQVADNSKDIAVYARNTQDTAENMITVIENSRVVFEDITSKMRNSSEISFKMAGNVQLLRDKVDEINNIITVVNEISDRTNLLALNAAIEAARAGEQGKGFAVVADEVRKLALQSSKSTAEISKLVANIISSIMSISDEAREEAKSISRDIEYADKSKQSFEQVIESAKETYDAVKKIHNLASQSTGAADNVNELMDNISSASQEAVAFAQEVSASAQEQSDAMQEMASLTISLKDAADHIDGLLKGIMNSVKLQEKEKSMIVESFGVLKQITEEIRKKGIQIEKATDFLVDCLKKYSHFEYMGILNASGIMVSETDLEAEPMDLSHRPYFKESITGKEYCSEPYISNFSFNYCITISIPFKDVSGRTIGVLMADLCIEK